MVTAVLVTVCLLATLPVAAQALVAPVRQEVWTPNRYDLNNDGVVDSGDYVKLVSMLSGRIGLRTPDANRDMLINILDFSILAYYYRAEGFGDSDPPAVADFIPDYRVDYLDLAILSSLYGWKNPDVTGDNWITMADVRAIERVANGLSPFGEGQQRNDFWVPSNADWWVLFFDMNGNIYAETQLARQKDGIFRGSVAWWGDTCPIMSFQTGWKDNNGFHPVGKGNNSGEWAKSIN